MLSNPSTPVYSTALLKLIDPLTDTIIIGHINPLELDITKNSL